MSRIYKGSETAVKYKGSAQSVGFQAVQTTSDAKRMQEYKQSLINDNATKQRELTRQQTAENTQTRAQQQADATRLKLEQTAQNAEMEMDQQFEKDSMRMDQSYEKAQLDLKAKHQQLSGQVQSANFNAAKTAINGLLFPLLATPLFETCQLLPPSIDL